MRLLALKSLPAFLLTSGLYFFHLSQAPNRVTATAPGEAVTGSIAAISLLAAFCWVFFAITMTTIALWMIQLPGKAPRTTLKNFPPLVFAVLCAVLAFGGYMSMRAPFSPALCLWPLMLFGWTQFNRRQNGSRLVGALASTGFVTASSVVFGASIWLFCAAFGMVSFSYLTYAYSLL